MLTEGRVRAIAAQMALAIAKKIKPSVSAVYEPAPDDLPSLFFTGTHFPATKAEEDVPNTVTYVSNTDRWTAHSTTKVQGSGSTANAKKNLTLKLYTDEARKNKKKVSFRGWPEKNKFVLKAYMPDITHARDPVTCRIFGDAVKTRPDYDSLPEELRNSPNQGAIDGFLVRVYLNGIYYGLYTLTIPKDDWMVGTSDCEKGGMNYDKHVLLCGEGIGESLQYILFRTAYPDISKVCNGYDFDDELDSLGPVTKQNLMEFQHLVVNGSDAEFKANISTYLDIESAIDAYLMIFYGCGVDTIGKNQTLLTYNSGKPWYITIYDADAYWGNHPSSSRLFAYDTEFQAGYITINGQTNRLYERLWECFREEIRARWNELKNTVFNPANVITSFRRFLAPVTTEDIELDSAPTTADGQFVDGSNLGSGFNSFTHYHDGDFAHLQNFVGKRFGYVDYVINHIKCEGIALDKSTLSLTADNDTVALVATVTPADCTETVVWSTDDESVATVTGGYVKGIYNGSCNITATCGGYSATCAVTVSGFTTPDSDNLADPNGGDWLAGYVADSNGNVVNANSNLVAMSNKIAFRIGDVFVVKGAQIKYAVTGNGKHAIYNADGQVAGPANAISETSTITVKNKISTAIMTEDWIGAALTAAGNIEDIKERGGYIRFQLKIFDGEKELATNGIHIHRFPDKASADAWIADNP